MIPCSDKSKVKPSVGLVELVNLNPPQPMRSIKPERGSPSGSAED